MTTTGTHINGTTAARLALAVVVTGLLAAVAAAHTPAGSAAGQRTLATGSLHVLSTTIATTPRTWSYGWPVKPFDRQHPVRGFLNDPRIGPKGGTSFHFGIDISAPDGTPVYAIEGGKVFMDSKMAVAVVAPNGHSFGYWHIVPVVKSHQIVRTHQLIGRIGNGWEHVHLAERVRGSYVNPLRDGGLGPYADHTVPRVAKIAVSGTDLVAVALDTPDPVVPGAWTGLPVTPSVIRWRVAGGQWRTVVDSRTMRDHSDFTKVFAPDIRQNHKEKPGHYSYFLQHGWKTSGPVSVEVAVSDTTGNSSVASVLVGAEV